MKKYYIIGIALLVGALAIFLLVQNKTSINKQVSDLYDSDVKPQATATPNTTGDINNNADNKKVMTATLHTSKGDITVEFFDKEAPNTVANFIKLAKAGFYNGVKFHRVKKGFMIQGGDPLTKDDSKTSMWGTGGPGYKFNDEIDPKSDLYTKTGYAKGVLAMANSGPNTNGSQFFIMTETYPLPPSYTIFGKVDAGQNVVDVIANVKTLQPGLLDRPVDAITINSISF